MHLIPFLVLCISCNLGVPNFVIVFVILQHTLEYKIRALLYRS